MGPDLAETGKGQRKTSPLPAQATGPDKGIRRESVRKAGEWPKPPPRRKGINRSSTTGDFRFPQSRCQTGRRGRAGIPANRSHVSGNAPARRRHPASPPSTRMTHSNQKTFISSPGFGCGATFRRLALVAAALPATRPRVVPKKRRSSINDDSGYKK